MGHVLLGEEYSLDVFRHSETNGEALAPQIGRQFIEQFETDVHFPVFLSGGEGGVQLYWQHIELPWQLILHGDALS
jgi:hypothetical protein